MVLWANFINRYGKRLLYKLAPFPERDLPTERRDGHTQI